MMAAISSAFWAVPLPGTVAQQTPSEKMLARLRWLALGVWAGFLWFNPPSLFQPFTQYCLVAGSLYCLFGHYFAYRHHKGIPLTFPIGLSDVVFVAALCGVSGGLFSPLYVYFYGLTLIAALRFNWQAGFGIALTAGMASGLLLLFVPLSSASIPELYPSLAFRFTLLVSIAGLAGLFSTQRLPQTNVPKAVPDHPQTNRPDTLREKLAILEMDPLLQQLVDGVLQRIPCRGVCVILLDPDTQACVNVRTAGPFLRLPLPRGSSLLRKAAPCVRPSTLACLPSIPHRISVPVYKPSLKKNWLSAISSSIRLAMTHCSAILSCRIEIIGMISPPRQPSPRRHCSVCCPRRAECARFRRGTAVGYRAAQPPPRRAQRPRGRTPARCQ